MKARGRVFTLVSPRPRTTASGSYRFDNQTRGLVVSQPNRLWVSDTTYFAMSSGKWCYLTFIVDVYTRVIIGFAASDSLAADANMAALQMAIECRSQAFLVRNQIKLIFHSDGGRQYIATDFVETLQRINATSSMGFVAQENAFAERVNGIIKGEYLIHWHAAKRSLVQLTLHTAKAVDHYNTVRLHSELPNHHSPLSFERAYAQHQHRDYEVCVKEWNHDPYKSTDKFTGTQPTAEG